MKLGLIGTISRPLVVGTTLLSAGFLAGLGLTASPEAVVTRSFTAALENNTSTAISGARPGPLIAGTEEFWLTQKRKPDGVGSKLEPAAWAGSEALTLAAGDRVTITSRGTTRVLEVVSVAEVTAPAGTAPAGQHQLLVTCRDTSSSNGDLVTFVTGGLTPVQFKSPRAL